MKVIPAPNELRNKARVPSDYIHTVHSTEDRDESPEYLHVKWLGKTHRWQARAQGVGALVRLLGCQLAYHSNCAM